MSCLVSWLQLLRLLVCIDHMVETYIKFTWNHRLSGEWKFHFEDYIAYVYIRVYQCNGMLKYNIL